MSEGKSNKGLARLPPVGALLSINAVRSRGPTAAIQYCSGRLLGHFAVKSCEEYLRASTHRLDV